ncbi:MAG: nucleotidyltransferase family protein [Pseudomonadota bacterium]
MSIPVPKTAMVLAAGHGTRMRPLTDTTAKPLIPVMGKSLFDRALDPLVSAGVERAIVNVCWCADLVEAHLKHRTDIEIIISDERDGALETGGGLAKARPLLGDDPVFVVNTDAFWASGADAPIRALANQFDPDAMDLALLVADKERALGFPGAGDFFLADDKTMTRRGEASSAPWAYAGVRIIKPQLYDGMPAEKFSALKVWDPVIAQGRLTGVTLDDFWLHVGTPDSLADAEFWLTCHGERRQA